MQALVQSKYQQVRWSQYSLQNMDIAASSDSQTSMRKLLAFAAHLVHPHVLGIQPVSALYCAIWLQS